MATPNIASPSTQPTKSPIIGPTQGMMSGATEAGPVTSIKPNHATRKPTKRFLLFIYCWGVQWSE
ncbi:hypothetical protein T492DRAFT_1047353 [Pavlovales sp. CCMP2436]|nr:hypothetical protein T492DRAFT_1047353 [Pavlovales sp. CCMP2436]